MREKKKIEGKSGDPGPAAVSCWPLFNKMDFLRGTVKHKRCLYFKKSIFVDTNVWYTCSTTMTNFQSSLTTRHSTSREFCDIIVEETEYSIDETYVTIIINCVVIIAILFTTKYAGDT